MDATKKEAAAANAATQAVETEKKKEDKQQTYRSKEQRAKAAQQRARMRQLEQQSEAMQAELDALNEEITKEEVYSDFNLMQEKCKRMDTFADRIGCSTGRDDFVGRGIGIKLTDVENKFLFK